MKRCRQCGALAVQITHEERTLDSLPFVRAQGLRVSRCCECGAETVSVPRLEELHRVIARAVALKPSKLDGREVRYLRKWLGWSGREFATEFDWTAEHVSRIENDRTAMSGTAERLLRMLVFTKEPDPHYAPHDVLKLGRESAPFDIAVRNERDRWHVAT